MLIVPRRWCSRRLPSLPPGHWPALTAPAARLALSGWPWELPRSTQSQERPARPARLPREAAKCSHWPQALVLPAVRAPAVESEPAQRPLRVGPALPPRPVLPQRPAQARSPPP